MMDRRSFLKMFSGAAVAAVAAEAIPMNRVWSFPLHVRVANPLEVDAFAVDQFTLRIPPLDAATLNDLVLSIAYENFLVDTPAYFPLRKMGPVDPFDLEASNAA